jgi:hypothetical protein
MVDPNGRPTSNTINSPSREYPSVLARSSAKDSESADTATAENGGGDEWLMDHSCQYFP